MTHTWWFRRWPAAGTVPPLTDVNQPPSLRKGHPCRVLARGRGPGPRNVLVEFADGERVVGTRYCVRRIS